MSQNNNDNSISEESQSTQDDSEIEIIHKNAEPENDSNELQISEFKKIISNQEQEIAEYQDKLKRTLADYQNLERKTKSDIEKGVNQKTDKMMLGFLSIYDDFILAKKVLADQKIDVSGLDAIVKNMSSLLSEYGVTPINAIGEIFDPNYHEAISVIEDSSLDDGTITKEIRKGYISQNRVIRPTIVEISKKPKLDKTNSE